MLPAQGLIVLLAIAAAGCRATPGTVRKIEEFGNPARAEFYRVQHDPAIGGATFVPDKDTAEAHYVWLQPLLTAGDFASASVVPVSTPIADARVDITLTADGRRKVQELIRAARREPTLACVWRSRVFRVYQARHFDRDGAVPVLEDVDRALANDLRDALKPAP